MSQLRTAIRLAGLRGMQHAERVAAVGPDQHHRILSFGHAAQRFLDLCGVLHRLAIDLEDHVALLQSGVVRGAARLYPLDHCTVKIVRGLQLLAHIGSDVTQPDSPAGFSLAASEVSFPDLSRLPMASRVTGAVTFLPSRMTCR